MDLTEITLTYNFTGHTVVITGGAGVWAARWRAHW